MTAYLVNHKKKRNLLKKREREMLNALNNDASIERLSKIAEKIREAQMAIFKMNFSRSTTLPASAYVPTGDALIWTTISASEIVARYSSSSDAGRGNHSATYAPDTQGLEESVNSFKEQVLLVQTSYGWGWTPNEIGSMDALPSFRMLLKELWQFQGVLRGGIGPIITENHPAVGLWCVFSTRHKATYNFTDKLGQYNLQIGRSKPLRDEHGWPRLQEGLHHGYGEVRLDDPHAA